MKDVAKEYALLFNAITDTEAALHLLQLKLIAAQRQAEELFLDAGDDGPETKSA